MNHELLNSEHFVTSSGNKLMMRDIPAGMCCVALFVVFRLAEESDREPDGTAL